MRPCGNCAWTSVNQPKQFAAPPRPPDCEIRATEKREQAMLVVSSIIQGKEEAKAALFRDWTKKYGTEPSEDQYFPKLNMFASLLKLGGVALQVNVGMEYDYQVFPERDKLWSQDSQDDSYVRSQQNELGIAISTLYTTCAVRSYLVGQERNRFKYQNNNRSGGRVSVLCYYIGNIAPRT